MENKKPTTKKVKEEIKAESVSVDKKEYQVLLLKQDILDLMAGIEHLNKNLNSKRIELNNLLIKG